MSIDAVTFESLPEQLYGTWNEQSEGYAPAPDYFFSPREPRQVGGIWW